jgi:hypothetical protein
LESQVRREFDELRKLSYETATQLELNYEQVASSSIHTVSGKLILNIPQLKEMIDKVGSAYQTDIIRLVIAHELGHQIQYRYYSNVNGGLVFECQADILAGFLLYQLIGKDLAKWVDDKKVTSVEDERYARKMEELNSRVFASLSAIFMEGSSQARERTHPTNEERRIALRDGFNYGNLWLYAEVVANVPQSPGQILSDADKKRMTEHLKKLLNYLPSDDVVTWSHRHARKILHDHLDNCKDIVVYTEIDWDTSSYNPFVYYEQKVKNFGVKNITLSYYNQVYTVKRTDPQNTLYWNLQATGSHTITIRPGEIIQIRDSLKWTASSDFMPRIVYLGSEGSLFTCTTLSDNIDKRSFVPGNHYKASQSLTDAQILGNYLAARAYFSGYIGSVGLSLVNTFSAGVQYQSLLQFSSAEKTEIEHFRQRNRYTLNVTFYRGENKRAAEQALQNSIALFRANNIAVQNERTFGDSGDKNWDIVDDKGKIGSMSYFRMWDGNYNVSFKIIGIDE